MKLEKEKKVNPVKIILQWAGIIAAFFIVMGSCSAIKSSLFPEEKKEEVKVTYKEEMQKEKAKEKVETKNKEQSKAQAKLPEYKITQERLDKSGMWYVTFSTPSTDRAELEVLVRHAATLAESKKQEVHSIFIQVENGDSSAIIASGKIALSDKGLAQTGLNSTKEIEYEYRGK